jgi:hypothetical protein
VVFGDIGVEDAKGANYPAVRIGEQRVGNVVFLGESV